MPKALGPMHLSNTRDYEAQRSNNFEVTFAGLGDDITLNVISFPLPTITNTPLEISHGNSKVKVAGQTEYEAGELVIRDGIGADVEGQLVEWRRKVYKAETDQIGYAADYKQNATIYEFAPDGSHVRTWKLLGCWPSSLNPGELSNESSDIKQITCTVEYDKAYRVLG